MSRTTLLTSLQNLFMEVLNETSLKIGATEDFQAHCEILAGIQGQIGRKLMPLVGSYRAEAAKKPQVRPPPPVVVETTPYNSDDPLGLGEEEAGIAIALAFSLESIQRKPTVPQRTTRTANYEAKYATSSRVTSNGSPTAGYNPARFEHLTEASTRNMYTMTHDCLDFVEEPLLRPSAPAAHECSICQSLVKPNTPEHTVTSCCHHFHHECLEGWVTASQNTNRERKLNRPVVCPICREPL